MYYDLSNVPYYEVDSSDKIEVFINGVSRCIVRPSASRLYLVFVPDFSDDDEIPF